MTKTSQLKKIRNQIWQLKKSPLYQYRIDNHYYPVLGQGSHDAKIIFIGEAPGKNEAETGIPFCGAAGKILDQLLNSINLDRQKVYITNIVKDRPPNNRDPLPTEIELYSPFLLQQINIIKPKVIVTLGRFSMDFILKAFKLEDQLQSISHLHGKILKTKTITIIPLYHPAVAIYNQHQLPILQQDFQVLRKFIH